MDEPTPRRPPSIPNIDGSVSFEDRMPKPVGVHPAQPSGAGQPPLPPVPTTPAKRRRWTFNRKKVLKITGIAVLVAVLAVGGWLGWKLIHNASKAVGGNLLGLLNDTKLNGEDQGRVNILLAGDSEDDPGHGGSNLTDSIMILSLDTKDDTAFMLSIPRDLWVNIPGYGHQKINAANADGGMPLLEQTIQQHLGITINYYALVDYSAFKQAVDTVGGIDVTIASSDSRGIYDPNISKADHGPLILKNGLQHLDGQTALNLARARNDPTPPPHQLFGYGLPHGDFDRAANQRLMLTALETKALSLGTLSNPVKIGQLLDTIGNNVHTDFKTNDLRRLYDLSKKIKASSIQSLSLNDPSHNAVYIKDYLSPDLQEAFIPVAGLDDFSDIQLYLRKLMSSDPLVRESAALQVLNGSGATGLAKQESTALEGKNLNVLGYDNATTPVTVTTIVDASGGADPATLAYLKSRYGKAVVVTTTSPYLKAYPAADFIIVLGPDRIPASPSPTAGSSSGQ
ncbi:MAG TPA: LCP family protein [Candidatus Saccharimonadia bacterium]|nr:LCP family protein [Candidatus Saccharimonadia bacterium]